MTWALMGIFVLITLTSAARLISKCCCGGERRSAAATRDVEAADANAVLVMPVSTAPKGQFMTGGDTYAVQTQPYWATSSNGQRY